LARGPAPRSSPTPPFPPAGGQGTPAGAHLELYTLQAGAGAYMPFELSAAAYRFGHSQVRPSYKINSSIGPLLIFNPSSPGSNDFSGLKQRPSGWTIDWRLFFNTSPSPPPLSSRGPAGSSTPTSALPSRPFPPASSPTADRSRCPCATCSEALPSASPPDRTSPGPLRCPPFARLTDPTPGAVIALPDPASLWFLCLAEAQAAGGQQLGPVAAKIVGEVVVGLLAADPGSYLNVDPIWQPTLGATPGTFTITDLLRLAATAT